MLRLSEAGKKAKAGQEVRLVDLPADAGTGLGVFDTLHGFTSAAELSKKLIDTSSRYYGIAALAFLEQITKTEYFKLLPDRVKTLCRQFIAKHLPTNSSGQVHRVCERFALIAAHLNGIVPQWQAKFQGDDREIAQQHFAHNQNQFYLK